MNSESDKEREYEESVSNNRDKFFKFGSRGFTILSYVEAIALLHKIKSKLLLSEWIWFLSIFIVFTVSIFYGDTQLREMEITDIPFLMIQPVGVHSLLCLYEAIHSKL